MYIDYFLISEKLDIISNNFISINILFYFILLVNRKTEFINTYDILLLTHFSLKAIMPTVIGGMSEIMAGRSNKPKKQSKNCSSKAQLQIHRETMMH